MRRVFPGGVARRLLTSVVIASHLVVPADTRAQTRTDSGGVAIIELATIQTTRVAFRIAATPIVHLGGLQSDERSEFNPRHALLNSLRVADGRIVVNDYSSIKIFDPNGQLLHVAGRRGQGPGEFMQTQSVCRGAGDSLIVRDMSLRRASVFTLQGTFVRTITTGGAPAGTGCFSDGSIMVRKNERINERSALPAERAKYLDRVADYYRVSSSDREARLIGSWRSFWITAFAAPVFVQVVGDRIYIGDSQQATINILDDRGKLTQVIRWREPRTRMTNDLLERRIRASVPKDAPRSVLEQRMQAFRAEPVLDDLPAFLQMHVDPEGRIWLEDYPLLGRLSWWTVLDRNGALLGRVEVPNLVTSERSGPPLIVEVLKDQVALKWSDNDGAVHLGYFALMN